METNLSKFLIDFSYHYNDLFRYIFAAEKRQRHPQEPTALRKFIKEHNLKVNSGSYDDIWDYIVANEHLHEWWML